MTKTDKTVDRVRRHKIPTGHFWCMKCEGWEMHVRKFAEMGRGECEGCKKRREDGEEEK